MKTIVLISVLTTAFILTGCNDKIYDVDYYIKNPDKAALVQQQCAAGEVSNQNCGNARAALYKINRDKIFDSMLAH